MVKICISGVWDREFLLWPRLFDHFPRLLWDWLFWRASWLCHSWIDSCVRLQKGGSRKRDKQKNGEKKKGNLHCPEAYELNGLFCSFLYLSWPVKTLTGSTYCPPLPCCHKKKVALIGNSFPMICHGINLTVFKQSEYAWISFHCGCLTVLSCFFTSFSVPFFFL